MEINYKVNTFKQGKELKRLGVKVKSFFIWAKTTNGWQIYTRKKILYGQQLFAYSCAELGELLPSNIYDPRCSLSITKTSYNSNYNNNYCAEYVKDNDPSSAFFAFISKHEAHAKADLFIHLLKKKIINPEKLKL